MTTRRSEMVFRFLSERRAIVLGLYAVLLAVAGWGLTRVRVDYSVEQFFLFGGPERDAFDELKAHFPREDLQVSAFLEVPGGLDDEAFATLEELAEAFRTAGLHSIRWLGETEFVEEVTVEGEAVAEFIRPVDQPRLPEARLRAIVEARRDHPLFAGALWNRDLTVFAVHGYLAPEENNDARRRELTSELQPRIADISQGADRIVLSGLPILRVTIPLALASDLIVCLGAGLLITLAMMYAYFRRARLTLLSLAAVVPAIALTVGGMGLLGREITVLSSSMPIVALVAGISDATHLLVGTRLRFTMGMNVRDATVDVFSSRSRTCFFTSLTTALGFLGLSATGIPLIVDFGVVTAVAVMVTWLVTLTLLPALLTFAPDLGADTSGLARWCDGAARRAESVLTVRPAPVLTLFGALFAAGLILGAGLRVNAYLIDDLKPGDPILEDLVWLEESGFGVFQVNVLVRHMDTPGHAPEVLQWTEDLESFAAADAIVLGAMSLPEFAREIGVAAGLDTGTAEVGPFDARAGDLRWTTATVRELIFLAELQGDDALGEVYLEDEGVSQLVLYIRDAGSPRISSFLRALETRLDSVPPPGGEATVTGTVKLTQIFWDQMSAGFLPGVAFSVFLVWLSMVWMFRSVRMSLLALLPNLFPLALLLGALRLGGFDLKPSTTIVFSIAFGIVVDNTIHFLGALSEIREESSDIASRLAAAIREVGPAIILSTLVVCAGYSALMASRFEALFLMGLFTALATLFAVASDLIGFPVLLRALGRRAYRRTNE